MRSRCEIVQDLLPLYVDGAVSRETAEFVKGHLVVCARCRAVQTRLLRSKHWNPEYAAAAEHPEQQPEGEELFRRYIRQWKRRMGLAFAGIASAGMALVWWMG